MPGILVKSIRGDHWEAVCKALCLSIEHLDSAIQELESEDKKFSFGFMKNRAVVEVFKRDRESIRAALLHVMDDKTDYPQT